jgi:hypothetical protein
MFAGLEEWPVCTVKGGFTMTITFNLDQLMNGTSQPRDADVQCMLHALAGVKLSAREAREVLPSIRNHKWYMGERLSRDVGVKVAAIDYFENIYESERVRSNAETLTHRIRRLAKDLLAVYLTHQNWKAHDGLFLQGPEEFTWPGR